MPDWKVTQCVDPSGTVWAAEGLLGWRAADGRYYPDLELLEQAVGSCEPTAVHNLPDLVAEVGLLSEASGLLEDRVATLRFAAVSARRALRGMSTRCGNHGDDFDVEAPCCAHPRDVKRALRALDAAEPQPATGGTTR